MQGIRIRHALASDAQAIEDVLDAAFGADRHRRTAYRVRQGTQPVAAFSFVAEREGRVEASLQCWPVVLRHDGQVTPLVMLGPVAVAPPLQGTGIGKALMRHALEALDAKGTPATMLIGDAEYYGRFGFAADPARRWELPGPFERHRLLVRLANGAPLPQNGEVGPDTGDRD